MVKDYGGKYWEAALERYVRIHHRRCGYLILVEMSRRTGFKIGDWERMWREHGAKPFGRAWLEAETSLPLSAIIRDARNLS